MIVTAASGIARALAAAAERAYPEECCGLLIGRRTGDVVHIDEAAEGANVASDRRRRFEVDPALRLALMRKLRGSARGIVGHYHSHPDGPAEPSAYDAALAFEPELVWLLVAVQGGRAAAPGAFRFDAEAGSFQRVQLTMAT